MLVTLGAITIVALTLAASLLVWVRTYRPQLERAVVIEQATVPNDVRWHLHGMNQDELTGYVTTSPGVEPLTLEPHLAADYAAIEIEAEPGSSRVTGVPAAEFVAQTAETESFGFGRAVTADGRFTLPSANDHDFGSSGVQWVSQNRADVGLVGQMWDGDATVKTDDEGRIVMPTSGTVDD